MCDPQGKTLILIIGDVQKWNAMGRQLPAISNIIYCEYKDFTEKLLNEVDPSFILTPLVSDSFDIVDLAVKLQSLEYSGALRALIPPMPNPQIILQEVMALCPTLDVDLVEITTVPSPVFH